MSTLHKIRATHAFEPGDRIKLVMNSIIGHRDIGEVFTVEQQSSAASSSSVCFRDRTGHVTWAPADYFELYARAGQFVPGDRVIRKDPSYNDGANRFKNTDVLTVVETPKDKPWAMNGENLFWAYAKDGAGPFWSSSSSFRLATKAEIEEYDSKRTSEARRFKVGDRVRATEKFSCCEAKPGAEAIVTGYTPSAYTRSGEWLNLKWDRAVNTLAGNQVDGCYYEDEFELVELPAKTSPPPQDVSLYVPGAVVECVAWEGAFFTAGKRYTIGTGYKERPVLTIDDGAELTLSAVLKASPNGFRLAVPAGGFQPGDTVEVTDSSGAPSHYKVGERLTVLTVSGGVFGKPNMVYCQGRSAPMYEHRFRLIQRQTPKAASNFCESTPRLRAWIDPVVTEEPPEAPPAKGDKVRVTIEGTVAGHSISGTTVTVGEGVSARSYFAPTGTKVEVTERAPLKPGDRVEDDDGNAAELIYVYEDEACVRYESKYLGLQVVELGELKRAA